MKVSERIKLGVADLKAENAALTKRVAELEEIADGRAQLIDDQRETIESIQSQLAWTPVSEGLPTEPGGYEFYDSLRRFAGWLTCFELRQKLTWPWIDDEGDEWNQPEFAAHVRSMYTHFRRIELPKEGET